jgi:hypothetical protein
MSLDLIISTCLVVRKKEVRSNPQLGRRRKLVGNQQVVEPIMVASEILQRKKSSNRRKLSDRPCQTSKVSYSELQETMRPRKPC